MHSQHESERQLESARLLKMYVGKYILVQYVKNLKYFNNATGAYDRNKIKSEEFNKWMAYLLIPDLDQSRYTSLKTDWIENNQ